MNEEQIGRIRAMEQALNTSAEAVAQAQAVLEKVEAVLPQLEQLARYYDGGQWMQDYDADQAGLLPQQLCRGVLTEDALYDFLGDARQLQQGMERLAARLKQNL